MAEGQPPLADPGGHWAAPPNLQEARGDPVVTLEGWLAFVYSLFQTSEMFASFLLLLIWQ